MATRHVVATYFNVQKKKERERWFYRVSCSWAEQCVWLNSGLRCFAWEGIGGEARERERWFTHLASPQHPPFLQYRKLTRVRSPRESARTKERRKTEALSLAMPQHQHHKMTCAQWGPLWFALKHSLSLYPLFFSSSHCFYLFLPPHETKQTSVAFAIFWGFAIEMNLWKLKCLVQAPNPSGSSGNWWS